MSKSTSGASLLVCGFASRGLRDGHRTPSMPHATPSGSLQAPPAPCVTSMTSLSQAAKSLKSSERRQVPSAPLSARQASGLGSRHASPRHGAWMPPMSIPGSPNLRQRVPSQRDLSENAHSVNAQGVHALVNKFEKRSTSYGAAARRHVSPLNLYLTYGGQLQQLL